VNMFVARSTEAHSSQVQTDTSCVCLQKFDVGMGQSPMSTGFSHSTGK
jgi:hypothetical protein